MLKVVYLNHKQNRRIDCLTTVLLKISRDKAFDRLRKVEIGKNTHRVTEISKRHKTAEKILQNKSYNIVTISSNTWEVESEKQPGKFYTVCYNNTPCCSKCQLICKICNVCIHQYTCSCLDSMLHNTVCKHAHLIEIYHNNIENTQPLESTYTDNPILEHPNNMQTDTPTYFTHILSKEKETELSSLKTKLKSIIAELQITIDQCTDVSTLQAMRTQLQSASSMSRAMKEHSSDIRLAVKRKIPPNRNQEKQLRVFSTKKKKLCATQALSKPSIAESNKQIDNLKKNDPKFCGVC